MSQHTPAGQQQYITNEAEPSNEFSVKKLMAVITSSFETRSPSTASKTNSCFSTYSVRSTYKKQQLESVKQDFNSIQKKISKTKR